MTHQHFHIITSNPRPGSDDAGEIAEGWYLIKGRKVALLRTRRLSLRAISGVKGSWPPNGPTAVTTCDRRYSEGFFT